MEAAHVTPTGVFVQKENQGKGNGQGEEERGDGKIGIAKF